MSQPTSVNDQIIYKAMTDPNFRQRLLSNPKTVLEKEMGVTLPTTVNIQVHEETETTVHLVLPAAQQVSVMQDLSDEELEQVAGGASPNDGCGTALSGCGCTTNTLRTLECHPGLLPPGNS